MMTPPKLLLFDPDPVFKNEMVSFFKKRNFHVLCCDHVNQILECAKSDFPEYFILDHHALNPHVLQSLQAFYAKAQRPIHFVFLSDKSITHPNLLKNAQWIQKPFPLSELVERIQLLEPVHAMKCHAKEIIYKLSDRPREEFDGVEWYQSNEGIFEGSHFFVADGPTHDKHILITECSHKGLGALIGIILSHEVFHGMVKKGFAFEQVIKEINRKLQSILPEGIQFYISYITHIHESKTLHVFNGGEHALFAYDKAHHRMVKYPGLNFNMNGAMSQVSKLDVVHLQSAHHWILFLDGTNISPSTEELMQQMAKQEDKITYLKQIFKQGQDFQLCIEPQAFLQETLDIQPSESTKSLPLDLDFSFSLNADSLKSWDPLPVIMHTLMEHQLLHVYRTEIFTILTELYTNALDHGVLQLDSSLKACPKGMGKYYEIKKERLLNLDSGYVYITVKVKTFKQGGELNFIVQDSGAGFDFTKTKPASNEFSGRGLSLIEALCTKLTYEKNGSRVKATFHWT